MKKKILICITVFMVLCLAGCNPFKIVQSVMQNQTQQVVSSEEGLSSELQSEQNSEEEQESITVDGGEEVSSGSEEASESEAVDNESGYLDIWFERYYDYCYEEVSLMSGHYDIIHFDEPNYPALTEAVKAYNDTHANSEQAYMEELKEWAREEYQEYGPEMFMGAYVNESEFAVRRADDQVLSLVETGFTYSGGAHGMSGFSTVNFDVATGEEIALESVVKDVNSLPGVLAAEILEKYPDIAYWTDTLEETFMEYITPSNTEYAPEFTWSLDYQGVTFYFGNYEIGSYADGVQMVTLTYYEYPQLLESKYFMDLDSYYVVKLIDAWCGSDIDLNNDGVTDYISVSRNYSSEPGVDYSESFDVTVNGNTLCHELYCYNLDTYFVKSGENNYLYIKRRVENDYESVSVFKITETSVEFVDEFDGGCKSFTNSLDFEVTKRMDLLSTYSATAKCYVGADGMPVEMGDAYEVVNNIVITSTVEITAELVDVNGSLTGESVTFPVGTKYTLYRTDGQTYVDALTDNGQWCRLYTTSEWPATVNGLDADSSFEMLYYAG